MIITDFSDIRIGDEKIDAVYAGDVKIYPKEVEPTLDKRTLRFTIVSGDTWDGAISAYTSDDRLIEPVKKDATGWTYGEDVAYLKSNVHYANNLSNFYGINAKYKECAHFFNGNEKLKKIKTEAMDMSECTSCFVMFYYCSNITSLELKNWDTSNVTNMGGMFQGCSRLTSLDLSSWDTSNVTNMSTMFFGCTSLKSIDLSNFNTTKVNSMASMFRECSTLVALDLSNFVLPNSLSQMFVSSTSLKTIKINSEASANALIAQIKTDLNKDATWDSTTKIITIPS